MTFRIARPVSRLMLNVAAALAVAVPGTVDGAVAQVHGGQASHVEVGAEDYAFRAPSELPSGWHTFRLTNEGEEHHFLLIARMPEGKTHDEYVTEVVVPFNEIWYELRDGRISAEDVMPLLGDELPEWFWGVEFKGGVGLVAPGGSAEATVNLEPGEYIIECYMRTPDGEFHSMEGMLDPLVVTEAPSGGSPPAADVRVTLSEAGISFDAEPAAGRQTFEVYWADHPAGTFGHDVQVVRLDGTTTADQVVEWMSFLNVEGVTEPAPGTFVGGINMMPAGSTAYFTVDLAPGRYLFVSEYTGAMGVLRELRIDP